MCPPPTAASQPRGTTMPDTTPGPASDAAASLTALLGDFGGLWQISKTPHGYTAQRRPPPAPPLVLTAGTVAALRELLQHGYDTVKLAAIVADFCRPMGGRTPRPRFRVGRSQPRRPPHPDHRGRRPRRALNKGARDGMSAGSVFD